MRIGLPQDCGAPGHINVPGRLYLLLWSTDADLLFSAGGFRGARCGVNFPVADALEKSRDQGRGKLN
jgi:hypothetical protein